MQILNWFNLLKLEAITHLNKVDPTMTAFMRRYKPSVQHNIFEIYAPGISSSGFLFSKYLFPNLWSRACINRDAGGIQALLILSNVSPRLSVSNVLHLPPPFPQAYAANTSDSPSQWNHGKVVDSKTNERNRTMMINKAQQKSKSYVRVRVV